MSPWFRLIVLPVCVSADVCTRLCRKMRPSVGEQRLHAQIVVYTLNERFLFLLLDQLKSYTFLLSAVSDFFLI